jgi:hypothetical protein
MSPGLFYTPSNISPEFCRDSAINLSNHHSPTIRQRSAARSSRVNTLKISLAFQYCVLYSMYHMVFTA